MDSSPFVLPVLTLWRRELIRFWREKARVLGFVGSPLIFWLVIGAGFGDLAFFFPGALTLTVMFSAVFSTMSLIEDRREGFLLSILVSPTPRSAIVLGKVLGSATLAWLQGLMFLLFLPLAGLWPVWVDCWNWSPRCFWSRSPSPCSASSSPGKWNRHRAFMRS